MTQDTMPAIPCFRVECADTKDEKVIIECSNCRCDVRVMDGVETVILNRGIYCTGCDDGAIHINMPDKRADKGYKVEIINV